MKSSEIRCWTIKPLAYWEKFKDKPRLVTHAGKADKLFQHHYEWMSRAMSAQLGLAPDKRLSPFWVFVQYNCKGKARPDLRSLRWSWEPGEFVLIEAMVPAYKILQSDHDLWTVSLNGHIFQDSKREENRVLDQMAQLGFFQKPFSDWPTEWIARMEKSWEKVFDLKFAARWNCTTQKRLTIQGTLWGLEREWVRKVKPFVAKKSRGR